MADFLDEKRKEIQARLNQLRPAVEEYELLKAADEALGGLANGSTQPAASAAPATRRPQRAAGGGGAGAGARAAAARAPRRRWNW